MFFNNTKIMIYLSLQNIEKNEFKNLNIDKITST